MKILLTGGGIGGLVAALSLHRAGHDVRVFESVPTLRPLGVGINLLPHAVKVLTGLGLAERLDATGVPTAELAYFNKFGQEIWAEPRGRAAGYHWPQYSIHRGRLQMLLLEETMAQLGTDAVRTGYHLASFEERGNEIVARFIDRETGQVVGEETGDVLIGADGIHSVVRKRFYPDEGEPRFSGRVLWRAVSEAPPYRSGRSMVMVGHADQKFVAYPIGTTPDGKSIINWIAELFVGGDEPPMKRDWNRRADKADFAPPFGSWRFNWLDVPALIDATDEVYEFPMVDRDPVPRWTFGRVTLLGDAAHPMYPIGSNGASQAILDAAALTEALTGTQDAPAALRRYEDLRREPTSQIVLNNRKQGPERVMQLAEERAPRGFDHVESVIPRQELEDIARQYKIAAGFDRETLNQTA
jgi:2-polyprenyl-6-methoxyphenol hydroxylase-like FAD-dependent oxidoreductase